MAADPSKTRVALAAFVVAGAVSKLSTPAETIRVSLGLPAAPPGMILVPWGTGFELVRDNRRTRRILARRDRRAA